MSCVVLHPPFDSTKAIVTPLSPDFFFRSVRLV